MLVKQLESASEKKNDTETAKLQVGGLLISFKHCFMDKMNFYVICTFVLRNFMLPCSFQQQCDDASRQLDELKGKLAQAEDNHGKTKQSLASKEQQLGQHEEEINKLRGLNSSKDEELELLRKTVSQHETEIVVMKNNISQELQSAPPEVDETR